MGNTTFSWKDDTVISKCFVCSQLGHNNPHCKNTPSCPFCGQRHSLQKCQNFDPSLSLESNISNYTKNDLSDLKCGLCASDNHDHGHVHSGLDRKNCHSYIIARERKFGPISDKIQNPSSEHLQNYLSIANANSDIPEIMSLATNFKVRTQDDLNSGGILDEEHLQPNKIQALP